jgi:hypothetical protein
MQQCVILIRTKEDKPGIIPAFPPGVEVAEELILKHFIVIEAGLQSGNASVSMHFVDNNGKDYIVQVTSGIMLTANGALQGAMQRFAALENERRRKN